jgi:hypothetical protein
VNAAAFIFGWLPAILAVSSLAGSVLVSWRMRSVTHYCLSMTVFAGVFWSVFTLYRIFSLHDRHASFIVLFGREWLNWVPHLIILAAFGIFAMQLFSCKTNADP